MFQDIYKIYEDQQNVHGHHCYILLSNDDYRRLHIYRRTIRTAGEQYCTQQYTDDDKR